MSKTPIVPADAVAGAAARDFWDVRPLEAYREGHWPGAAFLDVRRWEQLARSAEHALDRADAWRQEFGRLGIEASRPVWVYDDGRMTDGQGRTVDFKNTVVVMTSNLGSQMIQQMSGDDYQVIKLAVLGEVKTHFRPEFVNRIDEIVVFHALDEKNIK